MDKRTKTTFLNLILLSVSLMIGIVFVSIMLKNSSNINNEQACKINALELEISSLRQENEELKYDQYDTDMLESEFIKAMSEASITPEKGAYTISVYEGKWKEEMEKYYKLVYDALPENKRKWLSSTQEEWEVFTKNEILYWQAFDELYSNDSMLEYNSSAIFLNRYRARASDLRFIYNLLSK